MTAVPKITLDANCIINLFDSNSATATSVEELEAIVRGAMSQRADIAVTTRAESDIAKDKDEVRRTNLLARLRLLPVIGTVGRWDTSKWDSGDKWSDERMERLIEEVRQIVCPSLTPESPRYGNKVNDIDHLVGHLLNGRDIFVTDDRDIVRRREALKASPGIVVMTPKECAEYLDKLAALAREAAVPLDNAPAEYRAVAHEGSITFDYSNNNGSFQIGEGIFAFETKWTKASRDSIHAYRDAPSIRSIALARDASGLNDAGDATQRDYSSRTRTPRIGDVVIWQNTNGLFAATRVLAIKDDSRGDDHDELTFEYRILTDGSSNFA